MGASSRRSAGGSILASSARSCFGQHHQRRVVRQLADLRHRLQLPPLHLGRPGQQVEDRHDLADDVVARQFLVLAADRLLERLDLVDRSARMIVGDGQRPNSLSRFWLNCCASGVVASFVFSLLKLYSNGSSRKCFMPTTLRRRAGEHDGDRRRAPLQEARRASRTRAARGLRTTVAACGAPVEHDQHRRQDRVGRDPAASAPAAPITPN